MKADNIFSMGFTNIVDFLYYPSVYKKLEEINLKYKKIFNFNSHEFLIEEAENILITYFTKNNFLIEKLFAQKSATSNANIYLIKPNKEKINTYSGENIVVCFSIGLFGSSYISFLSDAYVDDYYKEITNLINSIIPNNEKEENGVWLNVVNCAQDGIIKKQVYCKGYPWDTIKTNYIEDSSKKFNNILNKKEPWKEGKILFLSGPAGTGKTTAIRSLMYEWRKNYNFFIIADPEKFLQNTLYYYDICANVSFYDDEEKKKELNKRNIIIMEDSADYVISEGRQLQYDKFGKLLNLSDGLLGQGMEDLFIITFNEKIEEIDPAFMRPGRCLDHIIFNKFSKDEGNEWLRKHDFTRMSCQEDITLAELYAKLNNYNKEETKNKLGF